jgi:hypothetical protein
VSIIFLTIKRKQNVADSHFLADEINAAADGLFL